MISVGERIKESIDYMEKGQVLQALTPACIALDITSQRHAGAKRSGRKVFKNFVREYLWLITYVGFPGLMTSDIRIPFEHPSIEKDEAGTIGIEDIIYHVIRCSLIHSDEQDSRIVWNQAIALGKDLQGRLVLHQGLVWSLISAVVFAPVSKNEKIPDPYWLQVGRFAMFISELWGRTDLAKRFVKFHTGIDLA